MAATATDITDHLEPRKVIGGQDSRNVGVCLGRHGGVENAASFGMLCEVGPEPAGRNLVSDLKTGANGLLQLSEGGPEGRQAEQPRVITHGLRMIAAQHPRCRRMAELAVLTLEHAVR